jgi:hypothetical protein
MSAIVIIGIIGSIVSIVSGIGSAGIFVFNRGIKKQLLIKQDISTYTNIVQCLENTIKELRKVTFKRSRIIGFSKDQYITILQETYEVLNENKHKLLSDGMIRISDDLVQLQADIAQLYLVNGTTSAIIDKLNEIYFHIININSELIKLKGSKILV